MLRTLLLLMGLAAAAYVGLCALLFLMQRSMIYLPPPARPDPPGAAMLTVPGDGAELRVSTRPRAGRHALVYFGGNAEDVTDSLPALAATFPEHALYLPHYRGYGGSSGRPSEAALFADALALYDRVAAEHAEIVVIGRSLGSGVAVHLASRRPVTRLVLVTPYDSIRDLAERQFPYLPVRWLLLDRFESWRYAGRVTAPTLILMAEHDEVIPRDSTEALHTRFRPGIARLEVIAGTSHNTIAASPRYSALLGAAH